MSTKDEDNIENAESTEEEVAEAATAETNSADEGAEASQDDVGEEEATDVEEPAEEESSTEDDAPEQEEAPAEDEAPVADEVPAEDEAPAAEEAPVADETPVAEEEVVPVAAAAAHDDHHHGHSETHFPMDEGEGFERQLVSEYTHGGHEYDPPMAKGLMIFTGALTVLVVLCAIAILQMFKAEKNAMIMEQAARLPKDLVAKRLQNANELTLSRKAPARNTVTVSIEEAKKDVVSNPGKIKAFVNPPQPPRPPAPGAEPTKDAKASK